MAILPSVPQSARLDNMPPVSGRLAASVTGDIGSVIGDTHLVPRERFVETLERQPGDIKLILDFL